MTDPAVRDDRSLPPTGWVGGGEAGRPGTPTRTYRPAASGALLQGGGATRGMRFLAVEDSASARKVFQGVLFGLGIGPENLRLASDAAAGLSIANEWQPDVVFLDMELWGPDPPGDGIAAPSMTGDALGKALLKGHRPPKVVVVTALDRDNPRVTALLGDGAVDVIMKPVRAARVHEVLERLGFAPPPVPPGRLR
jgi:CheY-like chemotaxis protein